MSIVPGSVVERHFIILRREGNVVLTRNIDGSATPFTTHLVGNNGPGREYIVLGHYFTTLEEAEQDFIARCQKQAR